MYEYKFVYVRGATEINSLLQERWEPVPHVLPVVIPPGSVATSSVYVFLRRELV